MHIAGIKNLFKKQVHSGSILNKLTEVIPDTKVCKGLTELDKNLFAEYLQMPRYKMQITPEEIDDLCKFDGNEFIDEAYELLTRKLGLDVNIRPKLFWSTDMNNNIEAAFQPLNNIILCNAEYFPNLSKKQQFILLRHELQHYIQNMDILRHEEIGEKALDRLTTNYIKALKQTHDLIFKQYPIKKAVENLKNRGEDINFINKYVELFKAKDSKGIDELFESTGSGYRQELTGFRNKIIAERGLIKKDSALTPKIQQNFDEFTNIDYYTPDGNLNFAKYFNSKTEKDAILAQKAADFQFSKECCYMKYAKKQFFNEINSEETIKALEQIDIT